MPDVTPGRTDCNATANVDDHGALACWLNAGHAGPHWDKADKLMWMPAAGEPGPASRPTMRGTSEQETPDA